MKKVFLLGFLYILILPIHTQTPPQSGNWSVVFEDEFSGTSLDLNKWQIETGRGRHQEWFDPDNVSVANGNLILSADHDPRSFTGYPGPITKQYSGSEVTTRSDAGNFKYGYFEARMRVPNHNGPGYFPAFWLTLKNDAIQNRTWPPELDVVEFSGNGSMEPHGTNFRITCDEDGGWPDRGYYWPSAIAAPDQYHVYGMEWNEFEVKWYVDNIFVGTTLTEDVPHDLMRVFFSMQVSWLPANSSGLPLGNTNDPLRKLYVDYVKVWKKNGTPIERNYEKWGRLWNNSDSGVIGGWNLDDEDRHFSGDYNGDGKTELLSISHDNYWSKVHACSSPGPVTNWDQLNHNGGNRYLGPWWIASGDQFLPGDFDGDGKDEVLCIHENNVHSNLLQLNGITWTSDDWQQNNGFLTSWKLTSGDRYYVNDFNGDGKDDLICFSANSQRYRILSFDGTVWVTLMSEFSGRITPTNGSYWNIGNADKVMVGDFDGNNRGDILLVHGNYAKLYEFHNNQWITKFATGSGQLESSWTLSPGDRFYTHDMDSNGTSELFCISGDNKYEKVLRFHQGHWQVTWNNFGSYQIYNRDLAASDKFLFGDFTHNAATEVLWIKKSWSRCSTTHAYLHEMPEFTYTIFPNSPEFNRQASSISDSSDQNKSFTIYPNPSNGQLTIELNQDGLDTGVFIRNHLGQVVFRQLDISPRTEINLSDLPKGVYVVELMVGNQRSLKKIILQ